MQVDRSASRQECRWSGVQVDRNMHVNKRAGGREGRWTRVQVDRNAGGQECKWAVV
jgi:hypothetical protein